jgi:hypothetical protein
MANKLVNVEGRVISVPSDATPDEIDQIAAGGRPQLSPPPMPPAPQPNMQESALGKMYRVATNPSVIPAAFAAGAKEQEQYSPKTMGVITGAAKGALHTSQALAPLINKIPVVGETLSPRAGINAANDIATPRNTAEKVGYTGEQIGEWLLPTGVESKAAGLTGKLLENAPQAAKYVMPLAKAGAAGIESGVRNMSQGGNFKSGAVAGGTGSLFGPVLQKGAAGLANIAMSAGKRVLKALPEGVNIGETVMRHSTGISPETITKQLGDKVAGADAKLSGLLSDAADAGTQVPLTNPRAIVADELQSAVSKNSPDYIKDVGKVGDQLKYQYGPDGKPVMAAATPPTRTGAGFAPVQVPQAQTMNPVPLPASVDPVRARAIKQGVDLSIGNWNPEAQSAIAPLQERVRGSIAGGIHAAVPGSAPLDAAMTNLIPARDAAWNVSFNPSITKSVFNRIARPTGALAGGLFGAKTGYDEGGIGGALAGGTIGIALPELIASPEGQMLMARTMANPSTFNLAKGMGLQFNRPSSLYKQQPKQ